LSKRVQNQNAAKFRLTFLDSAEIRYEVIYKNLLRDLRRFYRDQFSDYKDLQSNEKESKGLIEKVLGLVRYIFKAELLLLIGVEEMTIAFCIASLIFPKQMLKEYSLLPEKKN
jgi:hypothetical protein